MRAGAFAALLALAACSPAAAPLDGARLLVDAPEAHGYAISPDASHAAWIEGEWPDRSSLAVSDLRANHVARRRLDGYSLAETAYDEAGGLKVLARRVGFASSPNSPPQEAAILDVSADGKTVLSTEAVPGGRIAAPWHVKDMPSGRYKTEGVPTIMRRGAQRVVWAASMAPDGARFVVESFDEDTGKRLTVLAAPGPVESLLPAGDALYALTRSSESLPTEARPGPRLLTKVDLGSGQPAWSAPWAGRASALLARGPGGRLYIAVTDPAAPSLWEVEDRPQAVAAAASSAAAPRAERARRLRTAGWYFARLLPALAVGVLFLLFRR